MALKAHQDPLALRGREDHLDIMGHCQAEAESGGPGGPGPPGLPGRPGAGNMTLCQYKNKKETAQTAGDSADSVVILREDEHEVVCNAFLSVH